MLWPISGRPSALKFQGQDGGLSRPRHSAMDCRSQIAVTAGVTVKNPFTAQVPRLRVKTDKALRTVPHIHQKEIARSFNPDTNGAAVCKAGRGTADNTGFVKARTLTGYGGNGDILGNQNFPDSRHIREITAFRADLCPEHSGVPHLLPAYVAGPCILFRPGPQFAGDRQIDKAPVRERQIGRRHVARVDISRAGRFRYLAAGFIQGLSRRNLNDITDKHQAPRNIQVFKLPGRLPDMVAIRVPAEKNPGTMFH